MTTGPGCHARGGGEEKDLPTELRRYPNGISVAGAARHVPPLLRPWFGTLGKTMSDRDFRWKVTVCRAHSCQLAKSYSQRSGAAVRVRQWWVEEKRRPGVTL